MDPSIEAEIEKQKQLLQRRLYYDRNAERIRKQQLELYYKRKAAAANDSAQPERRGRKAKPREVVITLAQDGSVRVS